METLDLISRIVRPISTKYFVQKLNFCLHTALTAVVNAWSLSVEVEGTG
jgi:hypothetical protein